MTGERDSRSRVPDREWCRSGTPKPLNNRYFIVPGPGFPPRGSGRYNRLIINDFIDVPGFPYTKYRRALRKARGR